MSFLLVHQARIRSLFVLFALLFLTGALLRPLNGGVDLYDPAMRVAGKETAAVQIIGSVIYGASFAYLFFYSRKLQFNRALVAIITIVVFAMCSAAWGNDPSLSIRRSIALAGTTIFGLTLAVSFSRQEILFLLNRFIILFSVGTLVLAIIAPDFSYHEAGGFVGFAGSLRGSFPHKNDMGYIAGLFLVILAVSGSQSVNRTLWMIAMAIVTWSLVASRSMGSLVSVIAAIGGTYGLILVTSSRSLHVRVGLWIILLLFIGLLFLTWDDLFSWILAMTGRDPSLSDRTLIWKLVILAGADNWLLGSGYGVAWIGGAKDVVRTDLYTSINNAHNGFLELWLELGVVGVILLVWLFVSSGNRLSSNLYKVSDRTFSRMSVALLVYIIASNITIVRLVTYNEITWSLIVVVCYLANCRLSNVQGVAIAVPRPRVSLSGVRQQPG